MDNLAPFLSASHCLLYKKGHSLHLALFVLRSKKGQLLLCHFLYLALYRLQQRIALNNVFQWKNPH